MATPPSQSLAVSCPSCGARFHVTPEMAGRKGRCAKCGQAFRVPTSLPAPMEKPPKPSPTSEPTVQPIGVTCRVCQTRMYGRLDQVGQPLKCPDCGAQTLVPPPEQVRPKKAPAAMEGDQYELWGVDEAPSVEEMLAAQPKYIAVECRVCRTRMYATEEQVGQELKCPDCGTVHRVPPPKKPAPVPAVPPLDEEELEIDAAFDPGERPAVIVPPRRLMLYEVEREAELGRYAELTARRIGRGPRLDSAGRPIMPRLPLATRVVPFLFSRGVPVRWIMLSVGSVLGGGLMLLGASLMSQGEFGALGGVSFLAMGLIALAISLAAASAIVVTIVTESSEGNDVIQCWPAAIVSEWVGDLWCMIVACLVSPLPGWLVGQIWVEDPLQRVWWFAGSMLVCLPIVLLSQLEVGSAFAVASPRVVASLVRLPMTWLMFYVEIAALAAVCVAATMAIDQHSPILAIVLAPLYVAAVLLAARILGRLGWKLAETLPAPDQAK